METEICCLRKVGPYTAKVRKKDQIVSLEKKQELIIGRSEEATVCIPDAMISRKHAVLQKCDGVWTVVDNKSLNGCYINDEKLEPLKPHPLNDRDLLRLGVAPENNKPAVFVYEFRTCLKVRVQNVPKVRKRKQLDLPSNDQDVPPEKRVSPSCRLNLKHAVDIWSPSTLMRQKLREQEEAAQAMVREAEEQLRAMEEQLKQRDLMQEKISQEMKTKEEIMRKELAEQQERLDKERREFEEKMKIALEEELKQKEDSLKEQMQKQMDDLQLEKKRVEDSLQQEMARKLEEKDKRLEQELLLQKENLEKVIATKEANQKVLESQLNDTKIENEKQRESMLKAREDVLANFEDVLETELQCSICNELFVKATSLNCSHSFCEQCISTWMKRKKECPNCRAKITSHLRSIVLDSYIDTMVSKLSEELQNRRKELVQSRTGVGKATDNTDTKPQANTNLSSASNNPALSSELIVIGDDNVANEVVVLDDGSDDELDDDESLGLGNSSSYSFHNSDDDDDEDGSDYDDGIPGAYYGGYGHCFRCGARGHWANGCPYR